MDSWPDTQPVPPVRDEPLSATNVVSAVRVPEPACKVPYDEEMSKAGVRHAFVKILMTASKRLTSQPTSDGIVIALKNARVVPAAGPVYDNAAPSDTSLRMVHVPNRIEPVPRKVNL